MSNLISTVPGAFNALYGLLAAAGQEQSPPIPVFHTEVISGEELQNGYVLLRAVDGHNFDPAALGSYAFYETYDVCGEVVYYQGGPDPITMATDVLNQTWSIYQNVVMTTAVLNRGANGEQVLGDAAPEAVEWCIPVSGEYTGEPGTIGAGQDGLIGTIEFRYNVKARITTA